MEGAKNVYKNARCSVVGPEKVLWEFVSEVDGGLIVMEKRWWSEIRSERDLTCNRKMNKKGIPDKRENVFKKREKGLEAWTLEYCIYWIPLIFKMHSVEKYSTVLCVIRKGNPHSELIHDTFFLHEFYFMLIERTLFDLCRHEFYHILFLCMC